MIGLGNNRPHPLQLALARSRARRPHERQCSLSQADRPVFGGIALTIRYRSSGQDGTQCRLTSLAAPSAEPASSDGNWNDIRACLKEMGSRTWEAQGYGARCRRRRMLTPTSERRMKVRKDRFRDCGTPKSARSANSGYASYSSSKTSMRKVAAETGSRVDGCRTFRVRNAWTFSTTMALGSSSLAASAMIPTSRFRASRLPASASASRPRALWAELSPWQGGQAARSEGLSFLARWR